MGILLKIIGRPADAVRIIRLRPRWLGSFLILSLLTVAVSVSQHGESVRFVLAHLPASVTPEDASHVREQLDRELFVRSVFLPLRLLLGWTTFALGLMLACKAFQPGCSAGFQHFLSLEVNAESVLLLSRIAAVALPHLQSGGGSSDALIHPLSIGACVGPVDDFLLFSLLTTLNLFTLWYLVLLAYGAAVLCGMRLRRALLPAIIAWLMSLGFDLGVTALLREALHLSI